MKQKFIRITLEETKGSIATIETLEETLKELKQIKEINPEKITKEKREDIIKLQKDIENMHIEVFEAEYKGMFEVKETLNLNAKELQEFVEKL